MKSQSITLRYPFKSKTSPHLDLLEHNVQQWVDDLQCLPESVRDGYKKSNFGKMIANSFPNAKIEQLIPIGRLILIDVSFDDFYAFCTFKEFEEASQKVIEMLKGASPKFNDNEFFKQFALIRSEFLEIVPNYFMERIIEHHQLWLDGMKMEHEYNNKQPICYPTLDEYKFIRERIVGGEVACDMLEIVSDFIMPDEIILNPTIKRLRQLVSLIMSWFNDIHSVERELLRKETMNLVLVIQNEMNCSLESAYEQAIQIHNDDLNEFITIKQNLPDFGMYQDSVKTFVNNAELFLKAQESWYYGGTERYNYPEI